jgi:hypothetical protein
MFEIIATTSLCKLHKEVAKIGLEALHRQNCTMGMQLK